MSFKIQNYRQLQPHEVSIGNAGSVENLRSQRLIGCMKFSPFLTTRPSFPIFLQTPYFHSPFIGKIQGRDGALLEIDQGNPDHLLFQSKMIQLETQCRDQLYELGDTIDPRVPEELEWVSSIKYHRDYGVDEQLFQVWMQEERPTEFFSQDDKLQAPTKSQLSFPGSTGDFSCLLRPLIFYNGKKAGIVWLLPQAQMADGTGLTTLTPDTYEELRRTLQRDFNLDSPRAFYSHEFQSLRQQHRHERIMSHNRPYRGDTAMSGRSTSSRITSVGMRASSTVSVSLAFSLLELEGHAEKADVDSEACAICQEKKRNILFKPCKHIVSCIECARALSPKPECPVCRTGIKFAEQVYL